MKTILCFCCCYPILVNVVKITSLLSCIQPQKTAWGILSDYPICELCWVGLDREKVWGVGSVVLDMSGVYPPYS